MPVQSRNKMDLGKDEELAIRIMAGCTQSPFSESFLGCGSSLGLPGQVTHRTLYV
jgi:hypothetical protein